MTTHRTTAYTSDVTRVFPASGKFTADQRELYTIYPRLYQALMSSIKPELTATAIRAGRRAEDARIHRGPHLHQSEAPGRRRALRHRHGNRARTWRGPHGGDGSARHHGAVHGLQTGDGVHDRAGADDPGRPRLHPAEDVLVITETGVDNLSSFVPVEPDDVEKLMAEPGMTERAGPKDRTVLKVAPG